MMWNNEHDYRGFWQDFTLAEKFGMSAIKDTYERAFEGWKDNVEYYASLVMTLNHKIWEWYEKDEGIATVYNELWLKADEYGKNHFKGEDAIYYFDFLD